MKQTLFSIVKERASRAEARKAAPQAAPVRDESIQVPSDLFFRCPKCGEIQPAEEFEKRQKVCSCGYYGRLTAQERLRFTADEGSFVEYDAGMSSTNPLEFDGYAKKLERLAASTGLRDGVVTGECTIRGDRCVIGVMDSRFMMASMGSVSGEKIARAFERAAEKRLPVVLFTASGGARMQEGILSLMQMAKTSGAIGRHSREGLLYLTVLTDPTTGGVTASFASLGDILLAEPGATVGFAGRRVIEDTIREKLPEDFQTSEFLLQHGFVDLIVEREQMRKTLSSLIRCHSKEKPCREGGGGL